MGLHEALWQLYLVDQQLRGLESRLDSSRKHLRVQDVKLEQLQTQSDELTLQLKTTEAKSNEMELEVASVDERINHLREQMNSVKTNKEYSAMLVEVNTLKADKGKIEEEALEYMGRVEAYREELEALTASLADQTKVKQIAEKELAERTAEVSDRLSELQSERGKAAEDVPNDALVIFDRLAETMEGEPMCPIVEEDRRRLEYSCGGCYMSIPIERVNQLVTTDTLVRCPSCNRILYIEQEMRQEMGAS